MRHRKLKNLDERLAAYSRFAVPEKVRDGGSWNRWLCGDSDEKLFVEIGCGKGKFISALAWQNPECSYAAIEGQQSVLLRVYEKAAEMGLENLKVSDRYIRDIRDCFDSGSLDGIYLNFSDPWPKERHAKRRLTHRGFLSGYLEVLKPGGFIEFRTDNVGLFDFTLEEVAEFIKEKEEAGSFRIDAVSRDLHGEFPHIAQITTEYEDKFAGQGVKINFLRLVKE